MSDNAVSEGDLSNVGNTGQGDNRYVVGGASSSYVTNSVGFNGDSYVAASVFAEEYFQSASAATSVLVSSRVKGSSSVQSVAFANVDCVAFSEASNCVVSTSINLVATEEEQVCLISYASLGSSQSFNISRNNSVSCCFFQRSQSSGNDVSFSNQCVSRLCVSVSFVSIDLSVTSCR